MLTHNNSVPGNYYAWKVIDTRSTDVMHLLAANNVPIHHFIDGSGHVQQVDRRYDDADSALAVARTGCVLVLH